MHLIVFVSTPPPPPHNRPSQNKVQKPGNLGTFLKAMRWNSFYVKTCCAEAVFQQEKAFLSDNPLGRCGEVWLGWVGTTLALYLGATDTNKSTPGLLKALFTCWNMSVNASMYRNQPVKVSAYFIQNTWNFSVMQLHYKQLFIDYTRITDNINSIH